MPDTRRSLMVHAVMLGIAIPIDAAAERTPCPASLPAGFSLGAQQRFVSELEERTCTALRFSGEHLEWVERYGTSATSVLFLACEAVDEGPSVQVQPRPTPGAVDPRLREISRIEGRPMRRSDIEPPGWNLLSNPAFCGSLVAYIGDSSGRAEAMVYDLVDHIVRARMPLRVSVPGSDYRDHFPRPQWMQPGRSVEFLPSYDATAPITITLH